MERLATELPLLTIVNSFWISLIDIPKLNGKSGKTVTICRQNTYEEMLAQNFSQLVGRKAIVDQTEEQDRW